MKIFLIDNTIDGLLSALFYSFTENIIPDEVVDKSIYQPRIDALSIDVISDKQKANRVKSALFNYSNDDAIAITRVCMSSCDKKALTVAFNYNRLILKERADVSDRLGEKHVSDFSFIVQKVLHERHIMTGLLRFKESANGVLYAQYSPDNDITNILAPHFLRRLGHTPFIIHDLARNKIAISNGRAIKVDYTDLPVNFSPSENESQMVALWRRYFKDINIKERPHLKQQAGFMPHRYRKYCFETYEN